MLKFLVCFFCLSSYTFPPRRPMIICAFTSSVLVHKSLQNYYLHRFLLQSIASYNHHVSKFLWYIPLYINQPLNLSAAMKAKLTISLAQTNTITLYLGHARRTDCET